MAPRRLWWVTCVMALTLVLNTVEADANNLGHDTNEGLSNEIFDAATPRFWKDLKDMQARLTHKRGRTCKSPGKDRAFCVRCPAEGEPGGIDCSVAPSNYFNSKGPCPDKGINENGFFSHGSSKADEPGREVQNLCIPWESSDVRWGLVRCTGPDGGPFGDGIDTICTKGIVEHVHNTVETSAIMVFKRMRCVKEGKHSDTKCYVYKAGICLDLNGKQTLKHTEPSKWGGEVKPAGDPNLCVNLPANRQVQGQPLDLWPCNSQESQKFERLGDGHLRFRSNHAFCLGLHGQATNGARVTLQTCRKENTQMWTVREDGQVKLKKNEKFCLSLPADAVRGSQLTVWECNAKTSQKWHLMNKHAPAPFVTFGSTDVSVNASPKKAVWVLAAKQALKAHATLGTPLPLCTDTEQRRSAQISSYRIMMY